MPTMRALVKEGPHVRVHEVPRPTAEGGDVLVRVAVAGVCRSDVHVAEGRIAAREPIVLGHELAGVVEEVGARAQGLRAGDRVTVMPQLEGGAMLGIDRHGAFAHFVSVPADAVYPVPAHVPFRVAAYAEPVCAALAVMSAGITAADRVVIVGENRIARLTKKLLAAHGVVDVTVERPGEAPPALPFDVAIETDPSPAAIHFALLAVRPRGTVVLKSRAAAPIAIDARLAIRKELTLRAVGYGSFQAALDLLASGRLDVSDLLGDAYPLEDFARVFAATTADESAKLFFALAP